MRECWNGRQARLRCVCPMAWEFESPLSHQPEQGYPCSGFLRPKPAEPLRGRVDQRSTPTVCTRNSHCTCRAARAGINPAPTKKPGSCRRGGLNGRPCRSTFSEGLRESRLLQHLSSKAGWRILRTKVLELPAKAGSSRILQSVALRAPPPLKGRLPGGCGACKICRCSIFPRREYPPAYQKDLL